MCGIAGLVATRPLAQFDIYKFISSLRHRGPDNWGYYVDSIGTPREDGGGNSYNMLLQTGLAWNPTVGEEAKNCYQSHLKQPFLMMAHARLSILDLSSLGNQPMLYSHNNLVLAYNGEIYNYLELRARLETKGYEFYTETDSEVILAAYKEWGVDCVKKFNGMWGFAIFDRSKNTLFLSRDRLGVKPLFYTYNMKLGYWAFASEIKAFFTLPGMSAQVNKEICQNYILYGTIENTDSTFFKDIYRLPPACNLIVDLAGVTKDSNRWLSFVDISNYWTLSINNDRTYVTEKDLDSKAEEFYNLFADAVKIRLRADVRVGTALSGGLDSSSNVYVINQLLRQGKADGVGDQQYSFSSVFSQKEESYADESQFIDIITKQFNINALKVIPTSERLRDEAEKLIFHQDEPFSSTSMFAQWCVFSLPRSHGVLVTLDGQGADEQLAGYLDYLGIYWAKLPILDSLLYREIWKARHVNGGLKAGMAQLLVRKADSGPLSTLTSRVRMKRRINIGANIFGDKADSIVKEYMEGKSKLVNTSAPTLNEQLVYDTQNRLPTLLRYADRNSMAYGVESRTPFVDYRLAEYLASLPADYKVHNGWTKYIARCAMAGKIPDKITWRRDKMGFPTPEKTWLTGPLREWGMDIIKNSKILSELGVRPHIIDIYDNLAQDVYLWRLINLALWAKVFNVG